MGEEVGVHSRIGELVSPVEGVRGDVASIMTMKLLRQRASSG